MPTVSESVCYPGGAEVIGVRKVADTSQEFRAEHAPAFGGARTISSSAITKALKIGSASVQWALED
jgi:hypothetical protein